MDKFKGSSLEHPSIYHNTIWERDNNSIISNRNNFIKDYHIKKQSINNQHFLLQLTSPIELKTIEIYDSFFLGEKILVTHLKNVTYDETKCLLSDNWLLYPNLYNNYYVTFVKKIYLTRVSL